MTRLPAALARTFLPFLFLLSLAAVAQAVTIREVTSPSGIKALLVEDYTLPIISMAFSFRGGTVQDPEGRDGLTRLMTSLLDEGAGDMDSEGFRTRLEEQGIEIGFSAGRETVSGGLRTVAADRAEAFEMLRLALAEPRFDESAIERMRNAILLGLARSKTNPGSVGRENLRELLFKNHPYGRNSSGKETTVTALSGEDIGAMHARLIARDVLTIGVVGAISEDELGKALDAVFAGLPARADLKPVSEITPATGTNRSVDMAVPNASISLVYPGVKRDSPDFFAAYLMNHILGGGTFTSRLYNAVREERGLAYGVSSTLATLDHTAYLIAGTSTRGDNRDEAIEVIKSEVARLASEGVSKEELDAAKKFIAGSYAINNLDTSSKIARVLVAIQSKNLGLDYIDKRKDLIAAVTLEDVNRVARELLSVEPTMVVVGPAGQ